MTWPGELDFCADALWSQVAGKRPEDLPMNRTLFHTLLEMIWQLAGERKGASPTKTMIEQDVSTSKVRVEPAASIKSQTIKLRLDVHADTIVVVRILDHSAPQPAQTFTPAKFRQWVKTQPALADQVHSCYEAGPFGYGLHRELVALGIQNVVVQPVCLDERHTGVNHDKSDAKELALRLDRYAAGNTHALATVRVPTPAQEQARITSRQREQVKREQCGGKGEKGARHRFIMLGWVLPEAKAASPFGPVTPELRRRTPPLFSPPDPWCWKSGTRSGCCRGKHRGGRRARRGGENPFISAPSFLRGAVFLCGYPLWLRLCRAVPWRLCGRMP